MPEPEDKSTVMLQKVFLPNDTASHSGTVDFLVTLCSEPHISHYLRFQHTGLFT